MKERDVEPDIVDLMGGVYGFFIKYKKFLLWSVVFAFLVGLGWSLLNFNRLSGECVIRFGGAGNSYLTDVVLVLDRDALIDGISTNLDEDDRIDLREKLNEISSIEFSIVERSSLKCVVSFNGDKLSMTEAESTLVQAVRHNQIVSEYMEEETEFIEKELGTLEAELSSLEQLNSYIAQNPESIVKAQVGSMFGPSIVEITTRRTALLQVLQRIKRVSIVSPLRIESKFTTAIKFIVLNTIVILFLVLVTCMIHNLIGIYKSRYSAQ